MDLRIQFRIRVREGMPIGNEEKLHDKGLLLSHESRVQTGGPPRALAFRYDFKLI